MSEQILTEEELEEYQQTALDDPEVAAYCRVSTTDQSLDRQRKATASYIQREWDVDLKDIHFYEDKSTGTDVERDEYQEMMQDVRDGDLDAIAVKDLSRLSRSLKDLQTAVDRVVEEHDVELHFIDESMRFTGEDNHFQKFQLQILGAVAEFQAKIRQETAREGLQARIASDEDYTHGPAPLGYEKEDGHLYQKEAFPEVRETLHMVSNGELSKRKASHELDTSRATVRRAIEDRPELYGLDEQPES